ncbi:hypothetical protein DLF23_22230 [Salmonella enterica subsp. enterica serovar Newport]|nr:hypothetical protein [Salmonella enterica subsp. enterica serovar Newport]
MTTKVTKESLAEKINYLESVSKLGLSLNEEYQLKAYRLLLELMSPEVLRCRFCQFVIDESDIADHECSACGAYLE